jgi:hypothetical protein
MGKKNRQQQQAPSVTVGRNQRTPPILTAQDKLRARVEAKAKADVRVRELEAENAQLRRDQEFHALDRQCEEILKLRIAALKLTPTEIHRQANALNGAMARHKAKGLPAKRFDPYAVLNRDAERHGRAVPTTPKDANPLEAQLPPPSQEGHTMPNDAAAREAQHREAQERGARLRKQVLEDRQAYQEALRRHGLLDPAIGSTPGLGGLGS